MSSGDASWKRASTGPSKTAATVCTDCSGEFGFFKRKVNCSVCNDAMCTKCRSNAQYNLKCCKSCVLVSKPNLTALAGSYTLCEELSLKELIKIATHFKIERPPFMEKSELLILVWNRVIKLNAPNKHKSNGSTTRASPGGVSSNGNAANQPHQRATRGQPQATRTTTQAPRPTTSTQQQPPTRSAEAKASPDNPLAGIGQDISNAFKGAVSGIGDMLNSVDESINPSNRRASGPAQGSRSGTAARSNSNTQTSNSSTANPSARSHTNTSAGTPGTTTGTGTTANTNTNANSRTSPATQTTTHPNTGTDRRSPNTRTTGGDRSSSTPANADTDKDKKTLYLLEDLHTEDQVRALNIRQLKYVLQKQHVTYAGVVERRELHDMVMRLVRQQAMDNLGLYARSPTKRTRSKPEDAGSDGRSPNDTSATSLSMGIGDDDDEDKDMCKICYERHVNCVFLECGHLVTCVDCGFQLTECPICRQFITRRVHTFRA